MYEISNASDTNLIQNYLRYNNIPILLTHEQETDSNNYYSVPTIKLNPASAGPLAPMFSEITLDFSYGIHENERGRHIKIDLQYHYQHPSGSNGYSISLVSVNGEDFKPW